MIMKDDKDPSGSWIRIGMLGLVGRGPETVLVRLGTSHALSDGACLADGCSHLGKGQKTEETPRCVRLRLVGGSAQLTVEHPPHVLEPGGEEEREEDVAEVEAQKEWPIRNGRCTERANALRTLVSKSAALAALSM